MTESWRYENWNLVASMMSLTANCHRDPKQRSRPYEPDEFHPYAAPRRRGGMKESVQAVTAIAKKNQFV